MFFVYEGLKVLKGADGHRGKSKVPSSLFLPTALSNRIVLEVVSRGDGFTFGNRNVTMHLTPPGS